MLAGIVTAVRTDGLDLTARRADGARERVTWHIAVPGSAVVRKGDAAVTLADVQVGDRAVVRARVAAGRLVAARVVAAAPRAER